MSRSVKFPLTHVAVTLVKVSEVEPQITPTLMISLAVTLPSKVADTDAALKSSPALACTNPIAARAPCHGAKTATAKAKHSNNKTIRPRARCGHDVLCVVTTKQKVNWEKTSPDVKFSRNPLIN